MLIENIIAGLEIAKKYNADVQTDQCHMHIYFVGDVVLNSDEIDTLKNNCWYLRYFGCDREWTIRVPYIWAQRDPKRHSEISRT